MKILILLIALSLLSISCFAQVHIGTGQPYKNIQTAMDAGAIHPGDTVFIHVGTYGGWQGISKLKGNADKWIVFTRYKNEPIEIAGTWQFMSCEYIKFLNLNFKANTQYPGRLFSVDNSGSCETQSKFIIVDSCIFSNATDPASVAAFKFGGVDSFQVTNSIFRDMSGLSTMDYNVCHNGVIRGNRFENCLTGGHIKGGASNITMERNIFINASQASWVAFELGGDTGAQFYCPGDNFEVKNLKFYSNIIIGCYRGLALSSAVDCKVINNTFYNCGQATLRFLTTSSLYPTLSGNRIENNIFAFGTSAYINGGTQPAGAATFGKNIYYSLINATFNGPYWDTPDLDAIKDPNPTNLGSGTAIFVDGANNDLHLIAGSPAIGKGMTETEPATDYYGKPFSATARSIGAIEYETGVGVTEFSNTDQYSIYPNPTEDYIMLNSDYIGMIEIYNPLGIKVLESQYNGRIDVRFLARGIYFVKVGSKLYKFVKI